MIERKVANALALDYPRDRLELIVASDGSADRTVELAREAGADLVLDLPRGGKIAAQNAAVDAAPGDILAFSDANAFWAPGALRHLVAPFADPDVGYACGQVRFTDDGGNEEGAYWRYEMAVRELESRPRRGHRGQRRDLRGPPRRLPLPRPVAQPRPLVPVRADEARVALRLRARRASPRSAWCRRSRASSRASGG